MTYTTESSRVDTLVELAARGEPSASGTLWLADCLKEADRQHRQDERTIEALKFRLDAEQEEHGWTRADLRRSKGNATWTS
jgi:hypothetical protein